MNKKNQNDLRIMHSKMVLADRIKVCLIFTIGIFVSCTDGDGKNELLYNVRTDFRQGSRFYSICISESGKAYAIKGDGSFYTEPLKILKSDTSENFKLDSAKQFYESLDKIRKEPITGSNYMGAPRVEVYYDGKKFYDTYRWNEAFWDLFRPIMHQIPNGFNPFLPTEKPFE